MSPGVTIEPLPLDRRDNMEALLFFLSIKQPTGWSTRVLTLQIWEDGHGQGTKAKKAILSEYSQSIVLTHHKDLSLCMHNTMPTFTLSKEMSVPDMLS
jgi:hypothetical protein